MNGKRLTMITVMIFMLFLSIGTMTLYAASPKADAKKAIAGSVKTQYAKITKDAGKWGYTVARDKKEGKLKKSGSDAYEKDLAIHLLNINTRVFRVLRTNNIYSIETKKVSPKITVNIYAEKYKGTKIGKTEKYKNLTALAKLMKQCRTINGLANFCAKGKKDTLNDGFSANSTYCYFYLTKNCNKYSYSYSRMVLHKCFCSDCRKAKMGGGTGDRVLMTWNKNVRL